MNVDLAIRNGTIVDGTGAPRYRGDIGIRDGRIVFLGRGETPSDDLQAPDVIDASGKYVSPGFIDVHTHYDAQLFWDPALTPSSVHGITTAIGGNCGFSIAPLGAVDADRDYLMRMLAKVEGMPLDALRAGVPWSWNTMAEYLDAVEGNVGINVAFNVGHSAIRRAAMGADAVGNGADVDAVARMESLLRASFDAGAIGFSSSWGLTHIDGEGQPVPSRHADRNELLTLCRVVRDYEGTSLEFIPTNGPFPPWVAELTADMSVEAQRPLNWNILHVYADSLQDGLSKLAGGDVARAKGGKVIGLTMPISTSPRFSLLTGAVLESLPGWLELFALPLDERISVFRDPEARRTLNDAAQDSGTFININWSDHVIWDTFAPENEQFKGRTLGEIAQHIGGDPWSSLCEIAARDDLRTSFGPKPRTTTKEDWAARVSVWRDSRAVIGASDAGAHLDMVAGFSYCTGMLAAVRDHQLMSTEEAVHLLTDVQAQLYGIKERGQVQQGWHADLVIFDPNTIGSDDAAMRFDLPGGGGRLYAASTGVDHVIVNGSCLVRDGELTSTRTGSVLRSGCDTSTPSMA